MILQSLIKLYDAKQERGDVPPYGWSIANVTDRLYIDSDGNVMGLISARQEVKRGKSTKSIPSKMKVPFQYKHTSGIAPNFLCASPGYILGINKEKPERAKKMFESSKELHHKVLDGCKGDMAKSILRFFDTWTTEKANAFVESNEGIFEAGNIIIDVNGKDAQEDKEIQAAWDKYYESGGENESRGQCLVTGRICSIARLHPLIKGIRGGQASGTSIVSFNARSFESYGKAERQGLNAPVGEETAFKYGAALNSLTADVEHKTVIGDTTVVYWAESAESGYQDMFSSMFDPGNGNMTDSELKSAMEKIAHGNTCDLSGISISPDEPFYILGLAPNASRLSIRFFWSNTFGNLSRNLIKHYERMRIIQPYKDEPEPVPLWRLLGKMKPSKSKETVSPILAGSIMRAMLSNNKYPVSAYQNTLMRIYAEADIRKSNGQIESYKIGYERAAFIKAYLLKNGRDKWKEVIHMTINKECKEPAYLLGRVFAVLEEIQQGSSPGIQSTIKDRYFNSACATPSTVFPILLKLSHAHLRKLGNEKKEYQIYLSKKVGSLLSLIQMPDEGSPFPKRLDMEEQGAFILGYYQETQDRYTKKEEK